MLSDGSVSPSTDWTTNSYTVASCSGSVGERKVVLHVPPEEDIELRFDGNGSLVEVNDPRSIIPDNWRVVMRIVCRAPGRSLSPAVPLRSSASGRG